MKFQTLVNGIGFEAVYDNDVDVFIPELWANEAIAILLENMVAANLVNRNFENELSRFGDMVHVPRLGGFTAKRKADCQDVEIQDADATDVQVPLNQHFHTSFLICDGQESKSFKSLVDVFLRPAVISIARAADRIVIGQWPQFLANSAGTIGGLSSSNGVEIMLGGRQILNLNNAPLEGRVALLNPLAETMLLRNEMFTSAEKIGDSGTALRSASLGNRLGMDFFMSQNMPIIAAGNTTSGGQVSNAAGYGIGTTTMTVDTITGIIATGTWFTVAGDATPQRVTAHTETLGNTTSITFTPGLKTAIADNAVFAFYSPGAVNLAAGYAAGYAKVIVVDGFTVAPQVGQAVTFGSGTDVYSIIEVNGLVGITLDRPLVAAIVNDATVNLGPAGGINMIFNRDAIALVVRPLALPRTGSGALAAVSNWNGISMRVTISYQGIKQGHLVTVDMLAGVAVLDPALGAVVFN